MPLTDTQRQAIDSEQRALASGGIAVAIDRAIAAYDGQLARARDRWGAVSVRLNSLFGGVDPKLVLTALDNIDARAARWKQRGLGLKSGHPEMLGADGKRADSYAEWSQLGNVLIRELASTADDAVNASIDEALKFTAQETGSEIGAAAESAKAQLQWWAPFVVPALVIGGVLILLVHFASWFGLARRK